MEERLKYQTIQRTHLRSMDKYRQIQIYPMIFISTRLLLMKIAEYSSEYTQTLRVFSRFAGNYPYASEKCISYTSNSRCSCDRLPRSFYTFCRRASNQAFFDCTVCKNWGSGYHVCEDFFWCEVCNTAAKRCPLQVADL